MCAGLRSKWVGADGPFAKLAANDAADFYDRLIQIGDGDLEPFRGLLEPGQFVTREGAPAR